MGQAIPKPSEFEGEKGSTHQKHQWQRHSICNFKDDHWRGSKKESKTKIDVKEMSKKEPEQAEIYICNIETNPDDTVAHLCWGISRT